MKIVHLRPGDLFQFVRQRKPTVFRVVDSAASEYEVAGAYVRAQLRSPAAAQVSYFKASGDLRLVREVAKPCADSPTGMHEFSHDFEYDQTNPPMNCEHCGDEEPQS